MNALEKIIYLARRVHLVSFSALIFCAQSTIWLIHGSNFCLFVQAASLATGPPAQVTPAQVTPARPRKATQKRKRQLLETNETSDEDDGPSQPVSV